MVQDGHAARSSSVDRIKRAARELFAEQGYERTTIREVAERAGLTDAAVLYHVKSKRGLLLLVLEEFPFEPVPPLDAWDPEAVAGHTVALFDACLDHHDLFRVMISQAMVEDDETIAFNQRMGDAFRQAFMPVLSRWCGPEADEIVRVIGLVFSGHLLDALATGEAMGDRTRLRERVRRAMVHLLPPVAGVHRVEQTA